jgi:hypothetical protein
MGSNIAYKPGKNGEIGTTCEPRCSSGALLVALLEAARRDEEPLARSGNSEMGERESAPKTGIYLGHGPVRKDADALLQGGSVDGRHLRYIDD